MSTMNVGRALQLLLSAESGLVSCRRREVFAEFNRRTEGIRGAIAEQLCVSVDQINDLKHQQVELKTGAFADMENFTTWLVEESVHGGLIGT